jgi:hypothetical protein
MTVPVKQNVSFTYEKLDGEVKTVEDFYVDSVFTSADGNRIVSGWLEANTKGRAYREDRMSNVTVLEAP